MERTLKNYLKLFCIMFKIGIFTFGGGYAMISIIQREFTVNYKWISEEELSTVFILAESTPGPIAINSATYIGNKLLGFWGAFFATLGVVMPSFLIIFTISLFLDKFLEFKVVNAAFRGIQCAVALLIIKAGWKMLKSIKKNPFQMIIMISIFIIMIVFDLYSISFSSIYLILIGAGLSFFFNTSIQIYKQKKTKKDGDK